MDELPAQISLQMNRFLMIQNAVEDATENGSSTISRNLVSTRLEVLESNWIKFQGEHERLCRIHAGRLTDESYIKHRTYERCQEFYVQARAILLDQQDSVEASNSSSRSCDLPGSETRSGTRVRSLPKIGLPTFSGEFHAWKDFSDLFKSMVGENPELTNVEKMHYLKTCLAGDAARRVANLKVTHSTFNIAWETLESRYDNKRVLIAAQVDSLLDLKPIKSKSARELNDMMTTVTHALGALEALDCPVRAWDAFLVQKLARLLDEDTREDWNIKLGSSTSCPTLKEFEEFVNSRTQAWERRSSEQVKPTKDKKRSSWLSGKADTKARSLIATAPTAKGGIECRLCKAAHYLSNCPTYLSYAPERRKRTALKLNLCFNCLGSHVVGRCQSSRRCRTCGNKHHTTLHDDRRPQSKPATKTDSDVSTASFAGHTERVIGQRPLTLLATCQVKVKSRDGKFESVRALLDPGSEISFVTEELVRLLSLPRKSAMIPLLGIGGTDSGRTKGLVYLDLHSSLDISKSCTLQAYILPRLTFQIPSFEVTNDSWGHLRNLQLADPNFNKPGPINIIIGADCYGQIIKPELIKSDPVSPIAQLTLFGWAVSGPATPVAYDRERGTYHCHIDRDLQDLLTRFWRQEEIPNSTAKSLSPADAECEEHFSSTVSRDQSGRYVVRLPLKSPATLLGDSSHAALRCLARLRKRFDKEPSFCKLYTDFLLEYESLGHMVPVPESEINDLPVFYLPHHGVLRESSQTTKLRVVFNGSSSSNSGVSLNDILHAGVKLQTDVLDVLLWFRSHRVVFSSDITKMYRQILVHPSDRKLQRIFWYDSNDQPRPYQLTTVTYGLNCAPFLALRVLQQLISDEGHRFPKALPSLTKGRYVDDIFGGAESLGEAKEIMFQICQLCLAGGFPLQKWNSNLPELLSHLSLPSNNNASAVELDSSRIKVLGLYWQPPADVFRFKPVLSPVRVITKRSVLSEIAQLYDPLGLIAPVVIRAKVFIQNLWLIKVGWDTPLPTEVQNRWINFKQQLPALTNVSIPRWLSISSTARSIELHGFSDASQLAMAAVIYARVETQDRGIQVNIIAAKTKVAPLKKLTVPRLELNAALMLARLSVKVQNVLNLKDSPIVLWADSSVALTWISSHPAKWKDYVRNRVTAVQEILPTAIWRFVPGKENPADCATRGLSAQEIEKHSLWWRGPPWLSQTPTEWPKWNVRRSSNVDMEESSNHALTSRHDNQEPLWDLLTRYSSLSKLLRVTATCKRAVRRFRRLPTESISEHLTPSELQESCLFWVLHVQRHYFQHERKVIAKGGRLSKLSPLIRLTPFLDDSGLMRVGGRLQNAQLSSDVKHPTILPRQSPLTSLIIADAHKRTLHGGTQVTLAYVRQKYWIIGGRTPIRSFILKCVTCARYRKQRARQLMGQLPESRVTPSRPFLVTGVDYAGPISVKTWRGRAAKTYKGYLAIFVCFSTSAVHIEVVTDYTTEAFVAAYKRFTARRGVCATLHSDCGSNLVGADRELRRRFDAASKELKELAGILANHGTNWRFIPPAAPHFGGKWEAAVKSTKFHLRRVIGDSVLTYEELTTLTSQIEAVLNSRPLCPMSEDVDDFTALTPGHFLLGEAPIVIPEPNLGDQPTSRLTRWQLLRQKVEHFWKRWQAECLQRYQAISKWHHPSTEVQEGSLVLITDERYPPGRWPLARILQLHPGQDGLTRVVTVRTATATFKRPITKICVLPVDPEQITFGNFVPEGGRNVQLSTEPSDSA